MYEQCFNAEMSHSALFFNTVVFLFADFPANAHLTCLYFTDDFNCKKKM